MRNHIAFVFHDDGEGDSALVVSFHAKDFSGRGIAYFDADNISLMLDAFSVYPILSEKPPKIEWGTIDLSNPKAGLKEEYLHFSVWPLDTKGHLVASIRAAVPYINIAGRFQYHAGVDISTTYAAMNRFVEDMKSMLRGELSEVVLEEVIG